MVKRLYSISSILFLLFFTNVLFAQEYKTTIRHFTAEDGMSSDIVVSIFIDSRGFLWVATKRGVDIYNGSSFKKISTAFEVNTIIEDSKKRIWLTRLYPGKTGIRKTIAIYDLNSEAITPISEYAFGDDILQLGELISVQYYNGLVWLRTVKNELYYLENDRLLLFDASQEFLNKANPFYPRDNNAWLFDHIPPYFQDSIRSYEVPSVIDGSQFTKGLDTSLLSQWNAVVQSGSHDFHALSIPAKKDEKIKTYAFNPKEASIEALNVTPFTVNTGSNWIYSFNFLQTSEMKWWMIEEQLKGINNAGEVVFDSESRFTTKKPRFKKILYDSQGNLWASADVGLYLINIKKTPFKRLLTNKNKRYSNRGMALIDENTLFVNSYAGRTLVDVRNDSIINETEVNIKTGRAAVFKEDKQKIYVCGRYLEEYNIQNDIPQKHATYTVNGSKRKNIRIAYRDQQSGLLWLGGVSSLAYLDESNRNKSVPKIKEIQFDSQTQPIKVKAIYGDNNGLWVGALNGLFLVDPMSKKMKAVFNKENGKLPFNEIEHIYKDNEGILWLSTNGYGLIRFNIETGKTKVYGIEHGFLNLILKAVYEDKYGIFWIPSEKGLVRFNKETEFAKVYLKEDGIAHNEFNTFSHYQAPDGRLFFGGIDGITVFHPDSIANFGRPDNTYFIPQELSAVKLFDSKEGQYMDVTRKVKEDNQILVTPNYTAIRLEYNLFDYLNGKNTTYAYQIKGLDNNWYYQKSSLFQLGNIPYGSYQLLLKAKTVEGGWSEIFEIPLIIARPFYLEKWFLALATLAAIGLVLLIIYYRTIQLKRQADQLTLEVEKSTKTIREQNTQLEKANLFKDKILAVAAHDLRAPLLTLNELSAKMSFLIKKNRVADISKLSQTIDYSTNNVSILLNNLFNWALIQDGDFTMDQKLIDLKTLFDQIIQLYQTTATTKSITLTNEIESETIVYADQRAIETVFRNLLNNAIKFTSDHGSIYVRNLKKANTVIIEIKDNGVGIEKERLEHIFDFDRSKRRKGTKGEKGTGFGLVLCRQLVEMNNGDIYAESDYGSGSSFFVVLPTQKIEAT